MKICHVGLLPLEQMGTITRMVFEQTVGEHVYCQLDEDLPEADIYVLECFKNRWQAFYNMGQQIKADHPRARIVSLIHSSLPCRPALYSDVVVCLTRYSEWVVRKEFSGRTVVIPGGIDPSPLTPDYASHRFGRISRNVPGKFHPGWDAMVNRVLKDDPLAVCSLAVDRFDGVTAWDQIEYETEIGIADEDRKQRFLSRLSIAVFAHGDFEEVFPMSVLEAMAAGLPIVYLYQPSMHEMIGDEQFYESTIGGIENTLRYLLKTESFRKEFGQYARERAEDFSVLEMVQAWHELFEELAS